MGLTKVNYVNNQTVISAESMNAIQDAIIALEEAIGTSAAGIASIKQTTVSDEDGGTNVITINLTDGTSHSFQMKNGSKGSSPVRGVDYWTDEDKAEIASEASLLTGDEIDMLNYLLTNDTPACEPVVEATREGWTENVQNPVTGSITTWRYKKISVVITGIHKSLIKKVEIGYTNSGSSSHPSYTWQEFPVVSSDDTTHSVEKTYKTASASQYLYFGYRLTYCTPFGDVKTFEEVGI